MLTNSKQLLGRHLHSLDILRSVAILLVMCWHLPKDVKMVLGPISQNGLWGVDLFFILSGFLIADQLFSNLKKEQRIDFRSFYIRRLLRTWPCYFVVLLLYLLFPGFREHPVMPPLWKFLTFTQNFDLSFSAFSHAWSLCIEEQFYFILPIAAILLWKSRNRKLVGGIFVGLLVLGALGRAWIWFAYIDGTPNDLERQTAYFSKIYYPTWSRLDGLILGVSLAVLKNFTFEAWKKITLLGDWFFYSGLLILVLGFWLQSDRYSLTAVVFGFPTVSIGFAAIVVSALSPGSVINSIKIPGARAIAMLSYTLYLLHKQMFHLSTLSFDLLGLQNLYFEFGIMFFMSLLASGALHLLIERPFLVLRDRLTNK